MLSPPQNSEQLMVWANSICPAFQMSPLVNSCADNFLNLLQEHCDAKPFDIYE